MIPVAIIYYYWIFLSLSYEEILPSSFKTIISYALIHYILFTSVGFSTVFTFLETLNKKKNNIVFFFFSLKRIILLPIE